MTDYVIETKLILDEPAAAAVMAYGRKKYELEEIFKRLLEGNNHDR